MTWGSKETLTFLLDLKEKRGFTPQALLDRPERIPELEGVWRVFDRLSASRQLGEKGTPQPIAVSEVFALCQGLGYGSFEHRALLLDLVQQMDAEYLRVMAERMKQAMDISAES